MRSVWLENDARQRVSALAYVVDRGHVQYAGRLSLADQLRHVQQGHGRSGNNRDYVLSTVKSIEAQGFRDPQLHQLALMLHGDARAASLEPYLAPRTAPNPAPGRTIGLLLPRGLDQPVGGVLDHRADAAR